MLLSLSCACACLPISPGNDPDDIPDDLEGVWFFLSNQPQDDTLFVEIEDIRILKINNDGHWISVAYHTDDHRIFHSAGGTYKLDSNKLFETVAYHSKDLHQVGKTHTFSTVISGDSLFLSGLVAKGTEDEYKIKEYWRRKGN